MAITKEARDQLGARIVGHEGLGPTIQTETGLQKTKTGLIVPQSVEQGGTRSGTLEIYSEEEQEMHNPEPEVVEEQAVTTSKAVTKNTKKKKGQTEQVHKCVKVAVTQKGIGEIPTQYVHVYIGTGVQILGLNEFSFSPQMAVLTDNGLTNELEFDVAPGRQYIYVNNKFTDNNGIVNLVLVEKP